jgi:FAD/FMN-containing dehydrogenase
VHETVSEMDVLLASGEIVTCTAKNEHRDLFFGLPNSYGTLGYILKLKALTIPVKPYVRLTHIRIPDTDDFFASLQDWCTEGTDFVDGTVFRRNDHYLTVGRFVDEAPYTSDYTYLDMYYRSIPARSEDYLTTHDYLWRWDTDWFWCSKNLYVQNALMRRLLGRKRLNSITYQKVMRWNGRVGFTRTLSEWFGYHSESVIQDVDIPIENAPGFLDFFHREIGIKPLWICPVGRPPTDSAYPLFPMTADSLYINFGFWDVIRERQERPAGYYNRQVEEAVVDLGGIKSLYSSSYYAEEDFWSLYGGKTYRELKQRYDPDMRLNDLYQKSVLGQ